MNKLFIILFLLITVLVFAIVGKMNESDYNDCIAKGYGEEKCMEVYL